MRKTFTTYEDEYLLHQHQLSHIKEKTNPDQTNFDTRSLTSDSYYKELMSCLPKDMFSPSDSSIHVILDFSKSLK